MFENGAERGQNGRKQVIGQSFYHIKYYTCKIVKYQLFFF